MALAVRTHRTLELAGDNFYVITCGRRWGISPTTCHMPPFTCHLPYPNYHLFSGWRDSQTNETSAVRLELVSAGRKVR